jgi:hypothetical protein
MIQGDIEKCQLQFLEKIYEQNQNAPSKELTGILKNILNYSSTEIRYAMGEFGIRLNAFSSSIDRQDPHPDLFAIYDGELVSDLDGSFSRDASDMLRLASYGNQWGVSSSVMENLRRIINKHKSFDMLSSVINNPSENSLHVRFVSNRKERDLIRLNKRMQSVSTEILYKRGFQFWISEPVDFSGYCRGMSLYQSDLDEAKSRHKHFYDLGLKSMAGEIQRSIDKLEDLAKNTQYYGFNKIALTSASVILAKQSGYLYFPRSPESFDSDKIIIQTDCFKYRFFAHEDSLFDDSHVGNLEFSPRIYTYHEMQPYASPEIQKVIDHLEEFPEIGGHSLFDHYRVLVAGLNYPEVDKKVATGVKVSPFKFRLPNETVFMCSQKEKGQMRLDAELVQQKEVAAILLGEKDGDCYFISYF